MILDSLYQILKYCNIQDALCIHTNLDLSFLHESYFNAIHKKKYDNIKIVR